MRTTADVQEPARPLGSGEAPSLTFGAARAGLVGLIAVGAFVGYEWLMSGVTKLVRGGFPSGLSDELREKSAGTVGWYRSVLDTTVFPHAKAFGVAIELAEVAIGLALISAAILLLWRWGALGYGSRVTVLLVITLASLGAILMNVNFHLANGSPHPWLIPGDGFDEGVDLDSLLPLIHLALIAVSLKVLLLLRDEHRPPPNPGRPAETRAAGASTSRHP